MRAAHEAAMRRQRRGMRRLQHAMPAGVDHLALGLRVAAPEQEHQTFLFAIQHIDDVIGETFPALALMRAGAAVFHGQHRVEQQHAALGPGREIAMVGAGDAEIALDLLEDVIQRRRYRHAGTHRETQPVRLARAVVRILAEDHHFHRVERCCVEGGKDLRAGWIDPCAHRLAMAQERAQRGHLLAQQVIADVAFPGRFELDAIVVSHDVFNPCGQWAANDAPRSPRTTWMLCAIRVASMSGSVRPAGSDRTVSDRIA